MSNLLKSIEVAGKLDETQSGQYPAMILLVDVLVSLPLLFVGLGGTLDDVDEGNTEEEDDELEGEEEEGEGGTLQDPLVRFALRVEEARRRYEGRRRPEGTALLF